MAWNESVRYSIYCDQLQMSTKENTLRQRQGQGSLHRIRQGGLIPGRQKSSIFVIIENRRSSDPAFAPSERACRLLYIRQFRSHRVQHFEKRIEDKIR